MRRSRSVLRRRPCGGAPRAGLSGEQIVADRPLQNPPKLGNGYILMMEQERGREISGSRKHVMDDKENDTRKSRQKGDVMNRAKKYWVRM